MRRMTIFLALVLLAAAPAAAQPDDTDTKAELAKLEADPALSAEANAAFLANNLKQPGVQHTRTGLQFKIIQNGFGKHPGITDTVQVYYTVTLINGQLFDGTSPGLPAFFNVTRDGLVQGMVEALQMMREGDHWKIWIPANLGYGSRGKPEGGIPPNQTLIFDLHLLATKPAPRPGDPDCPSDPSCAQAAQEQQGQQ